MRRKISLVTLIAALVVFGLITAFSGSTATAPFHSLGDPFPRVIHQVFYHVEKKYVEPERASPRKLVEGALRALETQYPEVLVDIDEAKSTARVRVDAVERTFDLAPASRFSAAADVLNTVLTFVSANLGTAVEKKTLYYFALNGALGVLDPHSNALSPKHFKEFMIGTRGSFGGIGFVFGIRDGDMTIITPIEGTPADRGGLRSGDRILYIDGEPTINMPVDVAANKMRGEPGTQVTLTLSREQWPEPRALTFTREIIHVDSVESYVLGGPEAPVLYAKVKNFQKDTTDELRKAVAQAEAAHGNLRGIVLDLRNNPGGLLEQAIELSDGFMDAGVIVSTRGPESDANSRAEAKKDRLISRKPIVVLINQGSASASEIVTGALKGSRALVIGQKTFGKGSVQKLYPLTDGGALKLTVAQYLTPGDISIQSIGVQPDIAVYPVQVQAGKARLGAPPSHMEEAELENAFKEWGNASENHWAEIPFFEPVKEEDQRSFAELGKEEKLARLDEDFFLSLARRILARTKAAELAETRQALLAAATGELEAVRREEDGKIARTLAELGIAWDAGPGAPEAALEVEAPGELRLLAGETARISLSVRNGGTAPVTRVWGRTDSANPLLNNLDFPFGTVQPGETRTWTAEVAVPRSSLDRWDTVRLVLRQGDGTPAGEGTAEVRTQAVPRPEFAYVYELSDENTAEPARSGDGILEEAERGRFVIQVRNRGDAPSQTLEVNIRGDEKEQLYLEAARHKVEGLAPGATAEAPMGFRLVKADDEGKVSITVTLADREHGSFFSDTVSFPAGQPYPARDARKPPVVALKSPPPLRTAEEVVILEISVSDDEEVKEFYAYLGDKKIHYQRNRGGGKKLPVRLEVPLKPGSNRVLLAARDQKDLQTSRTFFVFRTEASPAGAGLGMR
ncbi:MAG: MXAN_5808 family serine peptidase [Thermodesulfobacteriota bacterium]